MFHYFRLGFVAIFCIINIKNISTETEDSEKPLITKCYSCRSDNIPDCNQSKVTVECPGLLKNLTGVTWGGCVSEVILLDEDNNSSTRVQACKGRSTNGSNVVYGPQGCRQFMEGYSNASPRILSCTSCLDNVYCNDDILKE